jgi:hypothetical protein
MLSADLILDREAEADRVVSWRFEALERVGYDRRSAAELAERTDIDLHLAVALARGGCPVGTALRILL